MCTLPKSKKPKLNEIHWHNLTRGIQKYPKPIQLKRNAQTFLKCVRMFAVRFLGPLFLLCVSFMCKTATIATIICTFRISSDIICVEREKRPREKKPKHSNCFCVSHIQHRIDNVMRVWLKSMRIV